MWKFSVSIAASGSGFPRVDRHVGASFACLCPDDISVSGAETLQCLSHPIRCCKPMLLASHRVPPPRWRTNRCRRRARGVAASIRSWPGRGATTPFLPMTSWRRPSPRTNRTSLRAASGTLPTSHRLPMTATSCQRQTTRKPPAMPPQAMTPAALMPDWWRGRSATRSLARN
ncbi:hypothetical protein D3C81_580080 [compost metagenome]